MDPNDHYHVRMCLPFVLILSQIDRIRLLHSFYLRSILKYCHSSYAFIFQLVSFLEGFPPKLSTLHAHTQILSITLLLYSFSYIAYEYVEIKCQLDATEVFTANLTASSTCFGQHYAHHQELKIIIQWLLPVVFGDVVFKLLVWCGADGYVPHITRSSTPDQQLENHSTKYHRQQPLYNNLELLMMGIVVPETC